ncbi:hypothetical protein GGU11DRAFT_749625 [Lentinula aff. detonsa]|nr:hypothetical protein GGU11DRAFT_749625 [Lentinula aff. detonsa]
MDKLVIDVMGVEGERKKMYKNWDMVNGNLESVVNSHGETQLSFAAALQAGAAKKAEKVASEAAGSVLRAPHAQAIREAKANFRKVVIRPSGQLSELGWLDSMSEKELVAAANTALEEAGVAGARNGPAEHGARWLKDGEHAKEWASKWEAGIKKKSLFVTKWLKKHWRDMYQTPFVVCLILNPFEGVECFGDKAEITNLGLNTLVCDLYICIHSRPQSKEPLSEEEQASFKEKVEQIALYKLSGMERIRTFQVPINECQSRNVAFHDGMSTIVIWSDHGCLSYVPAVVTLNGLIRTHYLYSCTP